MPDPKIDGGVLAAGGIAALLASNCCLGLLVLVTLGFSGASIGSLTLLDLYRPVFIGAALLALYLTWRRIFRPARDCRPGEVCAIARVRTAYELIFWARRHLGGIGLAFPYVLLSFC